MDPWIIPRWLLMTTRFWLRLVGPKWVFGGMAAASVLAVLLNHYL